MILGDTNVLVCASVDSFPQHDQARRWLDERPNGAAPVALPWASLLGFLRVTFNSRVFEQLTTMAKAWRQVLAWLACESASIPQPTERHAEILGWPSFCAGRTRQPRAGCSLGSARVEHGLVVCSTDGDFGRFAGLRWKDPLGSIGER